MRLLHKRISGIDISKRIGIIANTQFNPYTFAIAPPVSVISTAMIGPSPYMIEKPLPCISSGMFSPIRALFKGDFIFESTRTKRANTRNHAPVVIVNIISIGI